MPDTGPRSAFSARAMPAALLACAAVSAAFCVRAYDLFWHVVAGRWILEHGAVPRADPFRFTGESPWVDHEWLFQVLVATLEQRGGLRLLVWFRVAVVVALAAVLYRAARRAGTSPASAAAVGLAAVFAARARFFLRPELLTLLCVATLLALLEWARRGDRPRRLVWCVPLVVLWANAHPGALLAPPLAAAYLAGWRLRRDAASGRRASRLPWSWVMGVPLLLCAALLLNPSGWRIFAVPGAIAASLRGLPGTNPEWLPIWRAPQPALLIGAALLAGLLAWSWRRTGSIDEPTVLALAAMAPLAALSVRHQAPFFVVGAFAAAAALAALEGEGRWPPRALRRGFAALVVLGCALAAAWFLWPPRSGPLAPRQGYYTPGFALEPGRFPEHAVDRLERWSDLGPIYNDVAWGGYLLWRLYPPRRIFYDGRNEVHPELLRELARARGDSAAWSALLEKYGVDGALVRYDERPRRVVSAGGASEEAHTSSALLFSPERFALVYWDDTALLFVRRTPARAERLAREEYRFVQPEDWAATLARAAGDEAFRAGLSRDLERRVREAPPSRRAERLRAVLDR